MLTHRIRAWGVWLCAFAWLGASAAGAVELGALEDDVEWLGKAGGERVKVSAPGRDFAVARLLYETVGADRRSLGYIGTLVAGPMHDAEVHGIDAHYTSSDGGIVADAHVMRSLVDGEAGYGALFDLRNARSAAVQHQVALDCFDADVDFNDLGFLARNDYVGAQYAPQYANPEGIGRFKVIRGALVARQEVNLSEGQVVHSGLYWRNSMVLPGRNTVNTALAWLPRRYEDRDSRGNGAYRVRQRWCCRTSGPCPRATASWFLPSRTIPNRTSASASLPPSSATDGKSRR